MDDADIAVIGGGIAGASVAWHLSEETDRRIVVYERGDVAGETTAKSAAFFGFYGSDVERRMKRYGMARYNEFFADPRAEPRHDLVGRLRVATTDEGAHSLRNPDDGVATFLSGSELHERVLCPELDADAIAGARYRPHVGYHRPRELALEFVARARENGVTFETGTTVEDMIVEDGRVEGLTANGEHVSVTAVVCAAGPWNPSVAEHADIDLPVHHSLAPVLELEREEIVETALPIVSHVESGAYARDHGGGRALVAHYPADHGPDTRFDPAEVDDTVPNDVRDEMEAFLASVVPSLVDASIVNDWVGIRSHTPDGDPIVGWTRVEGLSIAAFNSSGIQLSPAVGRIIATQLVHGEPTDYYESLSISRFEGYDDAPSSLS